MSNTGDKIRPPQLWSDFDGTAVEGLRYYNPRNWTKYPLAGMPGYADFLRGVQSRGVEIGGVISRRPNIAPRRWATASTVAKLGLNEFFNPYQIVLAGSEYDKGLFIAKESHKSPVGVLEDKPHRLARVFFEALRASRQDTFSSHPITLGVVAHSRTEEYIERMRETMLKSTPGAEISDGTDAYFAIEGENYSVRVVALSEYTEEAGSDFGRLLIEP
jgi:hypothetical protein